MFGSSPRCSAASLGGVAARPPGERACHETVDTDELHAPPNVRPGLAYPSRRPTGPSQAY
jgi:hypothetical protein